MNTELTQSASEDTKERTRAFLFRFVRARTIQDTDDIFTSGMVNSLFAMQLVLFVEKEFGVKVANEDLDLKNFRSVDAITNFIARKRAT